MSKETGTLKELDVKPGDVVECVCVKDGYEGAGEILTINEGGSAQNERIKAFLPAWDIEFGRKYRIISRASDDTPKLWRDMTDEEKGALLLAAYRRAPIDVYQEGIWQTCFDVWPAVFFNGVAYRVKPEPVRETVGLYAGLDRKRHPLPIGTIVLEDGKPDRDSIKMEEL